MDKPLTAMVAASDLNDRSTHGMRGIVATSLGVHASPHVMVKTFHRLFGAPSPTEPQRLSVNDRYRRLHFILSEFMELMKASGFDLIIKPENMQFFTGDEISEHVDLNHIEGSQQDTIEMLDGLADIVYVCYGMAIEMGYDLTPVLREVHASNMTKGTEDGPIVNGYGVAALGQPMHKADEPTGKILKGPHYMKPQLARILPLPKNGDDE